MSTYSPSFESEPMLASSATEIASPGGRREPARLVYAAAESTSLRALAEQQWAIRRRQLLELRRLKSNWNGFGADAPNPAIIDRAIGYFDRLRDQSYALQEIRAPDRVVLAPDGAVIMEWQCDAERVEIEISDSLRAEWMRSRRGHKAIHGNIDLFWFDDDESIGDPNWQTEADSVTGGVASVYTR